MFVSVSISPNFTIQECNIESEVCCQIRIATPAPRPTTQRNTYIPPPPPTPKAQPLPTPCYERGSVCAPANQCYNGAVQRGSPYASRAPVSIMSNHFVNNMNVIDFSREKKNTILELKKTIFCTVQNRTS